MTNDRKTEVLEALLEEFLREEKIRLVSNNEFKRNLGNVAKSIGIPEAEIREVIEPVIRRLMDEMLAR